MSKKMFALLMVIAAMAAAGGLLAVTLSVTGALASPAAPSGAPTLVSYQGYLADDTGDPISGTVSLKFEIYTAVISGSLLWSEQQNSVAVRNGYFSVHLGSDTPLTAAVFAGSGRYLAVAVDNGGGFVDMPRQQFTSVPYALQAQNADTVPWGGISSIPPGVESGTPYANVIIVAKRGGDFTSVAAALDSIKTASADSPYLVWVAPGRYVENNLVEVDSFVHLQGSGRGTTVISATRSHTVISATASTLALHDQGRVSDLTVVNAGTGDFGIGIYSREASRDTFIDNVEARTAGGSTAADEQRFAVFLDDAGLTIRGSYLHAAGATGFGTAVNAALGSANISAGFPQALIEDSTLIGGVNNSIENCNDNTGTGYGLHLTNSSPFVRRSYICGSHRGTALLTNGHPRVIDSDLHTSSTTGARLFEIDASGSIRVAGSRINYFNSTFKFTGSGTGLGCVNNYAFGSWLPLSDGTTTATACN